MHEVSPEFTKCWQAAGLHIQNQMRDGGLNWLRANLTPPFLEHLSFRLGNQLFFIRIEDVDDDLDLPGNISGLYAIADSCKGHACLMPMMKKFLGGNWVTDKPGWGLIDARTGTIIDPINLVSDEKIEMTPWELQDFAVQVVRDYLKKDGYELMSTQGNPAVDPSIWFIGDSKGPEWVVVRAVHYPEREAKLPENWNNIAQMCAKLSLIGYFAAVSFASDYQTFETEDDHPVPLWRGHAVHVSYKGLVPMPRLSR